MPKRRTSALERLAWWCLAIALFWYLLGRIWAIGFGVFGFLFELVAYFAWVGEALTEKERHMIASIAQEELAKIQGSELVVSTFPGTTQSISLENVVEARLGDETTDFIGLVLTDTSGESRQHYIQTSHPNRHVIVPLVKDYVRQTNADT